MKKIIFIAIAFFAISIANAQVFGAKAGYNSFTFKLDAPDNMSTDETFGGFYIGVFTEFALSDMLDIQPELQYFNISEDGESSGFIALPIMFKYSPAAGLFIQAGPQINYLLEESVDDLTNVGVDLALGLGYDITEKFFLDAKYSLNLNNRYTGEYSDQLTLKYNGIQVGVGYKFN